MADMTTEFEGDYLSADSYEEGERLVFTIKSVSKAEFDDRETGAKVSKVVLFFNEKKPGLTLSKMNGRTLIQLHGKDSDGWIGKRIALLRTASPDGKIKFFKIMDKEPKQQSAAPL